MKRLHFGDVFEIATSKGIAYLQLCAVDKDGIQLVRVIKGVYPSHPVNLDEIVSEPELFMVHFPLVAACQRKLISKVGNYPLPSDFQAPEYMRTTYVRQGKFMGWHIVNTETLNRRFVECLSPSEVKLSPWGVWNDTLLKERIESGWNLENWTQAYKVGEAMM
jgi:hypothetical protein